MGCVNGKEPLSEKDLEFIATHTEISREEVEEQYNNFLSTYPDGKITRRSFTELMKKCYPDANLSKLEKHIFRMYDTNDDGYIDFKEFMIVLYILSRGSPEQNLEQIFRIFDINNDQEISRAEMKRIVKDLYSLLSSKQKLHHTDSKMADDAFTEMDVDKDGKVSKEEFIKACMNHEKISSMMALKIIDIFIHEGDEDD
jgi:Ca2+-binding EF-hand superfamily protein